MTAQQLADRLAEQGVEIDRRKISLADPIRTLGEHTVTVRLRGELAAELKVKVEAND
ncbi:MAG: 50S ribosomal L9 C-terminal domain-containing protein [Myxococcota bacterium]